MHKRESGHEPTLHIKDEEELGGFYIRYRSIIKIILNRNACAGKDCDAVVIFSCYVLELKQPKRTRTGRTGKHTRENEHVIKKCRDRENFSLNSLVRGDRTKL